METGECNGQAVRLELERLVSSGGFSRNERLSRFLRFVVERHLEGRDDELKESVIAMEVFGRKPDYDPKLDAIVRTEAIRLRARLSKYYAGEGSGDPVIIELPKGGYSPVFQNSEFGNRNSESERPNPESRTPNPDAAARIPNPEPRMPTRFWLTVALAALAVALAATGRWWVQRRSAPVAIAVLPLENLGHDPASDYFADGLTDELIRNLSVIEGLAVRSRISSFALKGKALNAREAGKQLDADYILAGSVLRAGQQLRINAELIRVRDDLPLWSGRFDRELTDIFAIQDEISRGIVNNLRLKLGRGRRRYETSVEAYDLYLRARALTTQYGTGRGLNQSIGPFEEVIAKDPSFAPAYAGLAAAYAHRSGEPQFDSADELPKMRAAVEKAIQLDPLSAEAHDALGMAYAREGQWEQSEKSFRHAIELDASRSMSYSHFAMSFLLPLGRIEQALQQLRVAEKMDPLSPVVQNAFGFALLAAGRYDEAFEHCQKLPADFPPDLCLGRARLGQGRVGEAIQLLATFDRRNNDNQGYLGYAYARAGRREEAEKIAADLPQRPFGQAIVFAGLGDKDRAIEALERSSALGPVRIGRDLTYPEFALIRGDPRLKAFRKKIGLPD